MKIAQSNTALVHEYLVKLGGAERVVKVLADMFPEAPIYTLIYDEYVCGKIFGNKKIITSFLQKFPKFMRKRRKYLFPLMPQAIEQFDLSGFDLVISSNSAYAHGVITPVETRHICYCNSPMRYAWDWYHEYKKEQQVGGFRRMMISYFMKKVRMWDKIAADRPDLYLANSINVQKRLKKYYRIDSHVVYPPVDVERFKIHKGHEDYFLLVSTLSPYKRVDLAVKLFNKVGKKLVIIGEGSDMNRLKSMASENIDFLGFKDDSGVKEYMEHCRALIFPGEEDFGIAPVEAQACGKPVLAYGKGGLVETVIGGKSGEFFYQPSVEAMEDALGRLIRNYSLYSPKEIRKNAELFSKERFVKEINEVIAKVMKTRDITQGTVN